VEIFPTNTFSHWHFWTWESNMEEQLIYLSHYHPQVGLHIQDTQLFEGYRPCTPLWGVLSPLPDVRGGVVLGEHYFWASPCYSSRAAQEDAFLLWTPLALIYILTLREDDTNTFLEMYSVYCFDQTHGVVYTYTLEKYLWHVSVQVHLLQGAEVASFETS